MSSTMDPAKLKVVELRAELTKRGLDAKGNKPALVKRLKDALEEELKEEIPDTSIADTSTEDCDTSQQLSEEAESEEIKQPEPDKIAAEAEQSHVADNENEDSLLSTSNEPEESASAETSENNVNHPVEEKLEEPKSDPLPETEIASEPQIEEAKTAETPADDSVEEQTKPNEEPMEVPTEENKENGDQEASKTRKSRWGDDEPVETKEEEEVKNHDSANEAAKPQEGAESDSKGEKRKRSTPSPERSQRRRSKSPIKEDEPPIDNEKVQLSWYDSDLHLQLDKESFLSAKPYHDGAFGFAWAGVRATHGVNSGKVCFEVKITEELKWEDFNKQYDNKSRREHKSSSSSSSKHRSDDKKSQDESNKSLDKTKLENNDNVSAETETTDVPMQTDSTEQEEKNEAEESNEQQEEKQEEEVEETQKEDETTVAAEEEAMDTTGSVQEENNEAKETQEEQQPEDEDNKEEKSGDDKEPSEKTDAEPIQTHLFRVGWSLNETNLQLGEHKFSYGYESTGRFVTEKHFQDYGVKFGLGDVISSYLNVDEENLTISYAVNGITQSEAITVPKSEIPENFVLFPHILSRNCAFELNLGNRDEPWFEPPEGFEEFVFLDKVETKLAGPLRPENRSDCEVILMCGLPASGKSHWVQEYIQSNPDKKYTVLGNSQLLERMTIAGAPLKSKYTGSWNILIEKLQKCLNKLVELAALRRRNYIIDQPNVFPSAQRRKLRPFEGFKRRAVVIVVGDEEQAKRQSLQEAQDGKDVPDSSVLEMKANMSLPHKGEWLDEVIYAGLPEDEAKAIVLKYNSQGRDAGYGIQRRFGHRDDRHRWQNRRHDYRGGNYRDNRNYHNNRYDRGPPPSRQGNWHQQRSGGGGGWNRDRRDHRGPPPPINSGRDWRNRGRDRGNRDSHGQGNNYNRHRSQGGSGGGSRSSGSNWQSGGGSWSQGGGGSSGGGWNNQAWSNQSPWNQQQGSWSGQSNQNQWKYGGGGGGGSAGGGGNSSGYSQGYANWNYYGQYPQNWNQQGQSQSTGVNANQYGQYSQQEWAQYAQQYAQQGQNASSVTQTPAPSATQK